MCKMITSLCILLCHIMFIFFAWTWLILRQSWWEREEQPNCTPASIHASEKKPTPTQLLWFQTCFFYARVPSTQVHFKQVFTFKNTLLIASDHPGVFVFIQVHSDKVTTTWAHLHLMCPSRLLVQRRHRSMKSSPFCLWDNSKEIFQLVGRRVRQRSDVLVEFKKKNRRASHQKSLGLNAPLTACLSPLQFVFVCLYMWNGVWVCVCVLVWPCRFRGP